MTGLPCPSAEPEPPAAPHQPPRRTLVHASLQVVDGQPVMTMICDCGTVTEVTLDGGPGTGGEFAVTCDGCSTSHWFSLEATR